VEDEQELVGTLCENNLITSVHFYDALNTAVSNAKCTGDLSYPISFLTKRPHFVLYRYTYPWPSQFLSLCLGPSKACLDALHNHAAFKFCEYTKHLEKQLTGGCGRINALLMKVEGSSVYCGVR
jgi:hypothetical protein